MNFVKYFGFFGFFGFSGKDFAGRGIRLDSPGLGRPPKYFSLGGSWLLLLRVQQELLFVFAWEARILASHELMKKSLRI